MPVSNYPNGFLGGVTIKNVPILQMFTGRVYWLNNSTNTYTGNAGSDSNSGTFQKPFATLAYAASTIPTASRGDIIIVGPGHAETISSATALTLSKAGVAIVGCGVGSLRPTFTLDTATTATINVTAANIAITNCAFVGNFADIVAYFTLTNAPNFTLDNCEFRDTASNLNVSIIVDTDATSNHADGLTIMNCSWYGLGATANSAVIKMDGTNARLTVKNNYFAHAATTDAGFMPIATGKVVTGMICDNNTFNLVGSSAATTGVLITTNGSTNSGIISRNFIQQLDATSEILVTASSGFIFSQNYASAVADKSGYLLPAADA